MAVVTANIPASIKAAMDKKIAAVGGDESAVVTAALAEYLGTSVHTLFQVSTSGALVAGVSDGVVTVKKILEHGDFGLGTFADLDGEMVVLDGRAYQVRGDGRVSQAPPAAQAPFAVVVQFVPQIDLEIGPLATFDALKTRCDSFRSSQNLFYACRFDGRFARIRTRAVNPSRNGVHLVDAAVEGLEPGVVRIDALQRHLQTEARGQRARERCLARPHHASDADQHGTQPTKRNRDAKRLFAQCD